ncbi:MAG TPA: hypothetical protein VHC44_16635 [Verrucomicrobiae bacterium]|nr:hypothetical protein [Verrucomicrobiae bacterium]
MKFTILILIGLAAGFCGGCSKSESTTASSQGAVHKHEHHPPHGGAPVELGEEEYHVEMVLDAPAGKMQAFVLDGELENFIRVAAPALEVDAQVSGHEEKLMFHPVANTATGEKVGDTSLFEAQADWLKTTPTFDGVLKEITVRTKTYTNIAFNFPKGSDEGAAK